MQRRDENDGENEGGLTGMVYHPDGIERGSAPNIFFAFIFPLCVWLSAAPFVIYDRPKTSSRYRVAS